MEFFAGYGFNKSHSTTYALLAYQTAYLKANYPRHFMAALLTIEAANTDKLAMYLGECRDLGVPILPPDINASQLAFTVVNDGVRFGLGAVKNVGEGAILSMLAVRKERGRIDSLYTLCEHVDLRLVNKRVLESLVKAGALDSLVPTAPTRHRRARPAVRRRRPGASSTAAATSATATRGSISSSAARSRMRMTPIAAVPLPDAPAWTESQQLAVREGSARPLHERPPARALRARS